MKASLKKRIIDHKNYQISQKDKSLISYQYPDPLIQRNKMAFKDTDKIQADKSLPDLPENQTILLEYWWWGKDNRQEYQNVMDKCPCKPYQFAE